MVVRQRILVPLDGSPLAEVALPEARTLAKLPQSEVILLQVVPLITDRLHEGDPLRESHAGDRCIPLGGDTATSRPQAPANALDLQSRRPGSAAANQARIPSGGPS